MRFNTKPEELPYHIGDKIDLAVQLEAREFRGQPSLTVIVRDMKFAAFNTEKNIASLASLKSGSAARCFPQRIKTDYTPTARA